VVSQTRIDPDKAYALWAEEELVTRPTDGRKLPTAAVSFGLVVLLALGLVVGVGQLRSGLAGPSQADVTIIVTEDPWLGDILTDAAGWTLYKLDPIGEGPVECPDEDGCTKVWPPVLVSGTLQRTSEVSGQLTIRTRPDRSKQPVYNGWPLYRYSEDEAPGDTNGHRVTDEWGSWSVVSPSDEPVD
jgi:predicted lipoprotein with Yx(FWY)xxD motif